MTEEENKKEAEEKDRQLALLQKLSVTEEFMLWRDMVAKPELEKVKQAKKEVLNMNEANLKGLILYEQMVEDLFYNMFDNINAIRK